MPVKIDGEIFPRKPVPVPLPAEPAPMPAAKPSTDAPPVTPSPDTPPPKASGSGATGKTKPTARKAVRDPLTDAGLAKDRGRRRTQALRVREESDAAERRPNTPAWTMQVVEMPIDALRPAKRRGRRTSEAQLTRLRAALRRFGFRLPVLVDGEHRLIAGHGLVEAARDLGFEMVPVIACDDLDERDAEYLALTLNRLGETGDWDLEALRPIIVDLADEDLGLAGFEDSFLDTVMAGDEEARPERPLEVPEFVVSRLGDVWALDDHRVSCMDAQEIEALQGLLDGRPLRAAFVDPPFNLEIQGFVTSKAHKTFVMGAGEMSDTAFEDFLTRSFRTLSAALVPGGVVFACMDWRSIHRLRAAGESAGFETMNLVVWNKGAGGQPGGLYRSAHELVLVLRKPGDKMVSTVKGGKYRTNVWTYPGGASLGSETRKGLASHSTPKNPAMVADAIADVTHRGDLVADTFLGGGTTLIAAERRGRVFVGGDLDPLYVDVALLRWQRETGRRARLIATGETYDEVRARRAREGAAG